MGGKTKNQRANETVNSSMCLTRLTNDFLNMILIIFKSILIVSIMPEVREAEYSVDIHHCEDEDEDFSLHKMKGKNIRYLVVSK